MLLRASFLISAVSYPILVIQLFHWMSREQAALVAGVGFLVSGLMGLYIGLRHGAELKNATLWTALIFLVFSAIPIFFGRLSQPGVPFEQLNILGFEANSWHKLASPIYGLFIMGMIFDLIRLKLTRTQKVGER